MQDRHERKKAGSMARELWRTEKDNSICEVVCYRHVDCTCNSENLQYSLKTKENSVF